MTNKDTAFPLHKLPGQTEAIYWIIVLVIGATAVSSLFGSTPVPMLPIMLTLFLLPLHAILAAPDKELRQEDQEARTALQKEGVLPTLQQIINELAIEIGYTRPVQLVISPKPYEARAFGSWRRHYIFLGGEVVKKLYDDWQSPTHQPKAKALLLHEISHLMHKDVQRITFTRNLLRSCFIVMTWWGLLFMAWLGLANELVPAMLSFDLTQSTNFAELPPETLQFLQNLLLSPTEKIELAEMAKEVSLGLVLNFVVQAFLPIIVIGFILWLFYWRKMVRMQEYYADSRASAYLPDKQVLLSAYGRYVPWFQPAVKPTSWYRQRKTAVIRTVPFQFVKKLPQHDWLRWVNLHPTYKERRDILMEPLKLNQNWRNQAIIAGVLLVAMENFLVSPLISNFLSDYPAHFSTIALFILISTWVLPLLVSHQPVKTTLIKMISLIFAIYFGWLLLNIILAVIIAIVAPNLLLTTFNSLLIASSGITRFGVQPAITNLTDLIAWIPYFLAIQLITPLGVLLTTLLYRIIHTPALRNPQITSINWHRQHWSSIITISIIIISFVLSPLTILADGDLTVLYSTERLISYAIGGLMFIPLRHIYQTGNRRYE